MCYIYIICLYVDIKDIVLRFYLECVNRTLILISDLINQISEIEFYRQRCTFHFQVNTKAACQYKNL